MSVKKYTCPRSNAVLFRYNIFYFFVEYFVHFSLLFFFFFFLRNKHTHTHKNKNTQERENNVLTQRHTMNSIQKAWLQILREEAKSNATQNILT